ncbi:hypothetical protein [Bradyrhizobium sp. CCBAU 51765]|uniref:hypothetical protein n=1 Tax=Bradyrhizobium sp. CCBAU 51765 TaxID=1325102 RepID=UPI00188908F2|nr:hypothetical protein [Bradyrhizobium sp. CCBAU 51765]
MNTRVDTYEILDVGGKDPGAAGDDHAADIARRDARGSCEASAYIISQACQCPAQPFRRRRPTILMHGTRCRHVPQQLATTFHLNNLWLWCMISRRSMADRPIDDCRNPD